MLGCRAQHSKQTLIIRDTIVRNDTITIAKSGSKIQVKLGNTNLGTFTPPTGHLIVFGQDGNDTITIDPNLTIPRLIHGGAGNDSISGGNGSGIVVGGDGADTVSTGNARDILIGGTGADTFNGGNGDDILIAGSTSYDAPSVPTMKALVAIQAEWTRTDLTYQQRINHLTGATPGGLNGSSLLVAGTTVVDDTSVDTLTGGGGNDWFLANVTPPGSAIDHIVDQALGEVVTDL